MALNGQRTVANVRERKRTQKLNQAYKRLQSIIPKEPSDKMSKINILKLALSYMKFLSRILEESECSTTTNASAPARVTVPDIPLNPTSTVSLCGSPEYGSSPDSFHSAYLYQSISSDIDDDQQYQNRSKRVKVSSVMTQPHQHLNTTNNHIYHPYTKIQQGVDICYHQTGMQSCAPSHTYSNLTQNYYPTKTFSSSCQMSSGASLDTTVVYDRNEPHLGHISHDNSAQDTKLELAQLFREYRSCNNFNLV